MHYFGLTKFCNWDRGGRRKPVIADNRVVRAEEVQTAWEETTLGKKVGKDKNPRDKAVGG